MSTCQSVTARILQNSRGQPDVEVELQTGCGLFRAFAASQLSHSAYDCVDLRAGDRAGGAARAVEAFRARAKAQLAGLDVTDAAAVDARLLELDDSADGRLGALGVNVALPLSQCAAQAAAAYRRVPLFRHLQALAGAPAAALPRVGFGLLCCPAGAPRCFRELYVACRAPQPVAAQARAYLAVRAALRAALGAAQPPACSETGALVADLAPEELLGAVAGALQAAGADVELLVDVAAGDLVDETGFKYDLARAAPGQPANWVDGPALCDRLCALAQQLPVRVFIDPFSYYDLGSYQELRQRLAGVQLWGQQLFSTRAERIAAINGAHRGRVADGLVAQLCSAGLVSRAAECARAARAAGLPFAVTASAGDSLDAFASHFAVGAAAEYLLVGGLCRGERVEKVNELLRIEALLAAQ